MRVIIHPRLVVEVDLILLIEQHLIDLALPLDLLKFIPDGREFRVPVNHVVSDQLLVLVFAETILIVVAIVLFESL